LKLTIKIERVEQFGGKNSVKPLTLSPNRPFPPQIMVFFLSPGPNLPSSMAHFDSVYMYKNSVMMYYDPLRLNSWLLLLIPPLIFVDFTLNRGYHCVDLAYLYAYLV